MKAVGQPQTIATYDALVRWVEHCAGAPLIAVDTESDSFHHYREKVCLLQMTANGEDAIIDPLAISDMSPLLPLFADPMRIKIFHDAIYDLICLRRDFGFNVVGIFDTMLASRILGHRVFGLAAILKERFGHEADKRLQRSDWTRRPLSDEQLQYARYDTHFLPMLVGMLRSELSTANRLVWAEEEFARLPEVASRAQPRMYGADPDGFWRLSGIRELSAECLGRVQALFMVREKLAERLDRPPFKIFSDQIIVELALHPPRSLEDFEPRPGIRRAGIERFGRDILEALAGATPVNGRAPKHCRPRRRSGRFMDPVARDRYEALRELRKSKAVELGIDPEVALSNAVLEEIVRTPPRSLEALQATPELAGWRHSVFTAPIWNLVAAFSRK